MAATNEFPLEEAETTTAAAAEPLREAGSFFSNFETSLTLVIFLFALVAIGFFYILIRTERATPFLLRIYVIIILVFSSLLIVSSSYSTHQIAPVIGFFGTVAGYLLGRSERKDADAD